MCVCMCRGDGGQLPLPNFLSQWDGYAYAPPKFWQSLGISTFLPPPKKKIVPAPLCVCVCVCGVSMCVCVCVCVRRACAHTCACVCAQTHAPHTHTHTYTHTYLHIHTYTHLHTHTPQSPQTLNNINRIFRL